mgnify:FL=1|jgi:hypothetical protein|tara:strand:- start:438 stop:602 length:165 start_codon:yes stop_codon:yes gene_type:complete
MDEVLVTAYDLKHQVECLPDVYRHDSKVDGYESELTLLERVQLLVKLLEDRNNA